MQINTMFPDHKGCKTAKGAQSRLDVALSGLRECADTFHSCIVQRPDGMWIAVVIVGHKTPGYVPMTCINANVCVTNV